MGRFTSSVTTRSSSASDTSSVAPREDEHEDEDAIRRLAERERHAGRGEEEDVEDPPELPEDQAEQAVPWPGNRVGAVAGQALRRLFGGRPVPGPG